LVVDGEEGLVWRENCADWKLVTDCKLDNVVFLLLWVDLVDIDGAVHVRLSLKAR